MMKNVYHRAAARKSDSVRNSGGLADRTSATDSFVDPFDENSTPQRASPNRKWMAAIRAKRGRHNLKLAMLLARCGIYVFPTRGKDRPLVGRFYLRDDDRSPEAEADRARYFAEKAARNERPAEHLGSTRDPATVRKFWRKWPEAIPCVPAGPNGLVIVDLDRKPGRPDGLVAFEGMFDEAGEIPPVGPRTVTPSGGGEHWFFRAEPGDEFGNSRSALPPEIDIRGQHAYVVAPGAVLMTDDAVPRVYQPKPGSPSLAEAFAMAGGTSADLPGLPPLLRARLAASAGASAGTKTDRGPREIGADAPEKDRRAAEFEMQIRDAIARRALPSVVGLARHVAAIRRFDPALVDDELAELLDLDGEPIEPAAREFSDLSTSGSRLRVARIMRGVDPAASVLDFAAVVRVLDGCGSWAEGSTTAGRYGSRKLARDWHQASALPPLLAPADGVGFGAVDEVETLMGPSDAVAAFVARVEAGEADADDVRLLRGRLRDAGLDRKSADAIEAEAVEVLLGCSTAGDLLAMVPQAPAKAEKPRKGRLRLEFAEDIYTSNEVAAPQLIDGYIEEGSAVLIYGKSNSGKSWFAQYVGFCVASGRPAFGREVQQGLVVYVAAEGVKGVRRRVKAWMLRNRVERLPFVLVPEQVALDKPEGRKAIIAAIREAEARAGQKAVFVVLDTLAKVSGAADENVARDMNGLVNAVGAIQSDTGAAVALLHHSGKEAARGPRGSSSLIGAMDVAYEVTATGKGLRSIATIRSTKQRDGDDVPALRFKLDAVPLGADAKGKPITSAILVPLDAEVIGTATVDRRPPAKAPGPKLTETEAEVMAAVTELGPAGQDLPMRGLLAHINAERVADFGPDARALTEQMLRKTVSGLVAKSQVDRGHGVVRTLVVDGFGAVDDEDEDDET